MITTIVAGLFSILEPLGVWAINKFISNQAAKADALVAYKAWIAAHKNDGQISASEGQNYQDQLNELKKDANAKDAGGQNGSGTKPPGVSS